MTREEYLKSLSPAERQALEKSEKAFQQECRNIVEYLNSRREAGAPRPAVFTSLGAYFFGEMCHLADFSEATAAAAVAAAKAHGERLYRLAKAQSDEEPQPTQKAAAA